MKELSFDVVIIGAGPAGLAAAIGAKKNGAQNVVIIERDRYSGGILPQCIHNGFGLRMFNSDLTGPEYAEIFIEEALKEGVEIRLETMVLEILPSEKLEKHSLICVNREEGLLRITSDSCDGVQGKDKGKYSASRNKTCRDIYSRICSAVYKY